MCTGIQHNLHMDAEGCLGVSSVPSVPYPVVYDKGNSTELSIVYANASITDWSLQQGGDHISGLQLRTGYLAQFPSLPGGQERKVLVWFDNPSVVFHINHLGRTQRLT